MIFKEDIEHLKDLARVEFGWSETEKLAKDLGDILGYIDVLKEADVSGVSEHAYATDLQNVMRSDASSSEASAEEDRYDVAKEIIDSFPEKFDSSHGTYLKVKSIL